MITINLGTFYQETAKLEELTKYEQKALELAGDGKVVKLTGRAPIWLYLRISHALHGNVKTLIYDSPLTGELIIYDHNPF